MIASALMTCALLASHTYHVPIKSIEHTVAAADKLSGDAHGIGPMGIPAPWLPVLAMAGFDTEKVQTASCDGIVAGAWVLAYETQWTQQQAAVSHWRMKNVKLKSIRDRAIAIQPDVQYAAQLTEIPASLINAVIQQESGFNPLALSKKKAKGLMQLQPAAAHRFGVTDPYDVRQNVVGGALYLRWLLLKFHGDLELALAGYNAGEGRVDQYHGIPPFKETRQYVPEVISKYRLFLAYAKN